MKRMRETIELLLHDVNEALKIEQSVSDFFDRRCESYVAFHDRHMMLLGKKKAYELILSTLSDKEN